MFDRLDKYLSEYDNQGMRTKVGQFLGRVMSRADEILDNASDRAEALFEKWEAEEQDRQP